MSVFDTIRDHATLGQIVSANSSNKTRCVAPDHEDSAPSMHVYEDHVHCFSCGFHGDVTDVWAAMRGFDRPVEAALDLAREFGVELPEVSPAARKRAQERREKEDLCLRQAQACHRALEKHPYVREWWEGRGFGKELRERFLLGTNKDGTAAVIPYWHRGRVQGLIRRHLEGEPKYIYPNAEEFPGKYRPLFIPAPLRSGVLLVEGIVDALALAGLGESSVAVGGAHASERQMQELVNLSALVHILPDTDKAGAEAGRKLVRALYPKALLCPPRYGDGLKDVADLYRLRGDGARSVLEDLKGDAVDALELELAEVSSRDDSLGAYRVVKERILPLLLRFEDEGEQDAALRDVARRLELGIRPLRKALAALQEAEEGEQVEVEPQELQVAPELVEELVGPPGVLDRYVQDAARIHGVVGEREHLKLLTLNATGAQLAPLPNGRPAGANLLLTAEAGRGKNHLADAVSSMLPEDFYIAFESASEKSLYYQAEKNPDLLKHAWIYPNEAEATDRLVEMFRPLISGGHASHLTVNKDAEGRNAAQEFKVEGPVTITIPTVRNKLDSQLQTRMLVSELPDYAGRVAAHSRAFSRLLLPNHAGEDHTPNRRAWQAALRSLATIRRVVFDLERKEFCFDSDTVSHGARLWGNLIGLMLAHAWLEQKSREIIELPSGELAVAATPEDYEAAYKVFKATCERSVVNLSDTHRKILDAVYELKRESDTEGFSHRKIAERAGTHHSTIGEHRTYLVKSVKLLRETESGMLDLVADAESSWWNDDDLLEGFPHPEKVWRWWEENESSSAPESTRHARHPEAEWGEPLSYAENPGGHPTRQPSATVRHGEDAPPVAGQETAMADEITATENGVNKPLSSDSGVVTGVAGSDAPARKKSSENGSRDLSEDEVQRVRRLVREGMAPRIARAQVLGHAKERTR